MTETAPPAPAAPAPAAPRWRRLAGRAALILVIVLVVVAIVRSFRRLDLEAVMDALGRMPWWSAAVLLALLLVRQVLNALPLAIFLPGTGLYRATVNDLGASTAAAFAPAPSDMVLRVAMFRSWGVGTDRAVVATAMNAVTFFIARFSAPLLGFLLLPLLRVGPGLRLLDVASLVLAAVLVLLVLLVVRGEEQAAQVGERLGRIVRTVRRSTVPEDWSLALRRSQRHVAEGFGARFPRALLASGGVLLADLTILTLCLRLMGVGGGALPLVDLVAAYAFAFPLTMFPAQGLGVMDTALLASISETAGPGMVEPALAAVLVWRTVTVAGPLLLGLIAVVLWRRAPRPAPAG